MVIAMSSLLILVLLGITVAFGPRNAPTSDVGSLVLDREHDLR